MIKVRDELKRLVRLKLNTKTAKDIEDFKNKNVKEKGEDSRNGDDVKRFGKKIKTAIKQSILCL